MIYKQTLIHLITYVTIATQPNGYSVIDRNGNKFSCGGDLQGSYVIKTNQISLCQSAKDKRQTLLHELGHYVFWTKLSDSERTYWDKICGLSKVACDEQFATGFRQAAITGQYMCYNIEEHNCDKKQEFMSKVIDILNKSLK